jgi:hypothetical protein
LTTRIHLTTSAQLTISLVHIFITAYELCEVITTEYLIGHQKGLKDCAHISLSRRNLCYFDTQLLSSFFERFKRKLQFL